MRTAAASRSHPLVQQGEEFASAENRDAKTSGSTMNAGSDGSSSMEEMGSSSGLSNNDKQLSGERCWGGKTSFTDYAKTPVMSAASHEALQLQQRKRLQLLEEQRLCHAVQQRLELQQYENQRPQEEEDQVQAAFVCGKPQRKQQQKQQQKQPQKQQRSGVIERDVCRASCGASKVDAEERSSDGNRSNGTTKGRIKGNISRSNSNSLPDKNGIVKKDNKPADSARNEHVATPHKELQVTADYTLISRGLVDMTYMQLEAARLPEEIPPPEVGEVVESKAAHPDAQIFKARVLDRWRDPEHLWLFKLRSPDMAAPYLEPLKHVRKDSVWTLARELDIAGGRKSRRSSSAFQQQHSLSRSSSCVPYSFSAAATKSSSKTSSSGLQTSSSAYASASAPATCVSTGKKHQQHKSAAVSTATATAGAQATGSATTIEASVAGVGLEMKTASASRSHGPAAPNNSYAAGMRVTAGNCDPAFSSPATKAEYSLAGTAVPSPRVKPSSGIPPCNPLRSSVGCAYNITASYAVAAPCAVGEAAAASAPQQCRPPAAAIPTDIAAHGNGRHHGSGHRVAEAPPLSAASEAASSACAAESSGAMPLADAVAEIRQSPTTNPATRTQQPTMVPRCSNSFQQPATAAAKRATTAAYPPAAAAANPAAAAAASRAAAATKATAGATKVPVATNLPTAAPTVAPVLAEEISLFRRQLAGCSAAQTPQQEACAPLSYSSLLSQLYMSPKQPLGGAAAAAVESEKAKKGDEEKSHKTLSNTTFRPASTAVITASTAGQSNDNNSRVTSAALAGERLAPVERRCGSNAAESSRLFVSPSLGSAKRAENISTATEVCFKEILPSAPLSLAAGGAWPPRTELLLKDGIGLHQQRLQRLFLAAAATTAAARELEEESQHLEQSQQQHEVQQRHEEDGSEETRSSEEAAAFVTPSFGEIKGVDDCCIAAAAAASSNGAERVVTEENSSCTENPIETMMITPASLVEQKNPSATTAEAPPPLSPLLEGMHQPSKRDEKQQPLQRRQSQDRTLRFHDNVEEAQVHAQRFIKPRRSIPAYDRLERMLFLQHLLPYSPPESSFFPASPSVAVTGASTPAANIANVAATVVTSLPISTSGACASAKEGPDGERKGSVVCAGAPTSAAATAPERTSAATSTKGSTVGAAVQQSAAAVGRNLAVAAEADKADVRLQKDLPDTKKFRSSNNSSTVETGCINSGASRVAGFSLHTVSPKES